MSFITNVNALANSLNELLEIVAEKVKLLEIQADLPKIRETHAELSNIAIVANINTSIQSVVDNMLAIQSSVQNAQTVNNDKLLVEQYKNEAKQYRDEAESIAGGNVFSENIIFQDNTTLQQWKDSIVQLLTSDDTTLDELQEIVNFIKLNKTTLDSLSYASVAETENVKHFTTALRDKLVALDDMIALQSKLDNTLKKTGDQSVVDIITFQSSPLVPNLTNDYSTKTANTKFVLDSTDYSFFDKPNKRNPLFIKISPSSFKIPIGTKIRVENTILSATSDITLSLETDLDVGNKTAGTDYFVYAKTDGTFLISADDTLSVGRLIGGFHYGLTTESEIASGNKLEADMVKLRGINAHSFWDLKFRANHKTNKGLVYKHGRWYDIYLMDEDYALRGYSQKGGKIAAGTTEYGRGIPKIPVEFGGNGTLTYGAFKWIHACEVARACGKYLISLEDFMDIAYGVQEGTDSSVIGEAAMGQIEHYGALTSSCGLEQATGVQYIWSCSIGLSSGSAWSNTMEGRGQIYSSINPAVLGGNRTNGSYAGSRCSFWNNSLVDSYWYFGARFACDHLMLD